MRKKLGLNWHEPFAPSRCIAFLVLSLRPSGSKKHISAKRQVSYLEVTEMINIKSGIGLVGITGHAVAETPTVAARALLYIHSHGLSLLPSSSAGSY